MMKKLKKTFFATALLLVAVSFSACNNESEVINLGNEQDFTTVTFSISIPKGDPVTYAIHDADEWGIESLMMYEFVNDTLVTHQDIKSALTGTGPEFGYQKEIPTEGLSMRKFIFVANETPSGITNNSTTVKALKSKLAQKELNPTDPKSGDLLHDFGGKKRIPMTGEANIAMTNGAKATVYLTRIVARIDIKNDMTGLVINSVHLNRTPDQSFLFPAVNANGQPTYAAPATATNLLEVQPYAAIPVPFDKGKEMNKAFYLYETPANTSTTVVLTCTLNGEGVIYTVPFFRASDLTHIPVKRNHIYRIRVYKDAQNQVAFNVVDEPWKQVIYNEEFAAITTTFDNGTATTFDRVKSAIETDKTAKSDIKFTLTTKYTGHSSYTVTSGSPTWLTAAVNGNELTVTVTENTMLAPREGVLTLKSNANPDDAVLISVKQLN